MTVHQDGCPLLEDKYRVALFLEVELKMEKHCSSVKLVTKEPSFPERLDKFKIRIFNSK